MTEAISKIRFFSKVLRLFMMATSNKTENHDWASASVCVLVATALNKVRL